jgi:hypothetical protein
MAVQRSSASVGSPLHSRSGGTDSESLARRRCRSLPVTVGQCPRTGSAGSSGFPRANVASEPVLLWGIGASVGTSSTVSRRELVDTANREGVLPSVDAPDGGRSPETCVLVIEQNGWSVYYSERGLRTNEVHSDTEYEACDHLFIRVAQMGRSTPRRGRDRPRLVNRSVHSHSPAYGGPPDR